MLSQPSKAHKPAILALSVAIALQAVGQVSGNKPGSGKMAFDAVSVRASTQELPLKGADFLNPAGNAAPPQGGLISWNVQLPWLINFAYDLRNSQARRQARESLPKWAQETWFTVDARAEGEPSREDVRQMVRSLLKDRFHFAAHTAKHEGQIFALVVAKQGLGLKPHPESAPCTLAPSQMDEKKFPDVNPSYEAIPPRCGVFGRRLSHDGDHRLELLNVKMQQVADALGLGLPYSVIDKTGLAGRYDAVLDFGSDSAEPNTDSANAIGLPPLPGALERQLGLRLVKQNAQVDSFVIDHIEKLSDD